MSQYGLHEPKYKFDLQGATPPISFHESSFPAAETLLHDIQNLHNPSLALQHAISYGIPVGLAKKELFEDHVIADLHRYFRRKGIAAQDIPDVLMSLKGVVLRDECGVVERFRLGTTCKVASANGDQEWILEISTIFQVGPVDNNYYIFVNGIYYIPTYVNGNIAYHLWTQTQQTIPRNYVQDSIQPTCQIKRKVIMYPDPSNLNNPGFFLCIDFKKPELVKYVDVPIYPEEGETVRVLGTINKVWFALVRDVDYAAREAKVHWYRETRRQGIWTLTNQEDSIKFCSITKLCTVDKVFGGLSIV